MPVDPFNPYAPQASQGARFARFSPTGMLPTANANPGFGGAVGGILSQANQAGFFDPNGSPRLRAALQRQALLRARNQRRQGQAFAGLAGLDPYQARDFLSQTNRQAGSDLVGALQSGDLSFMQGNQDWVRQLLGQERGYEEQRKAAALAAKAAKEARGGGWKSTLGGILGAGAGSFLGPIGSAYGAKIGG